MFIYAGCQKDHLFDCFKSSGKTISESRDAIAFSNINLRDNVDLLIYPDTTPYIKVTAGDNLLDGIITELNGSTLYIRNDNRCNWMRSLSNKFTVEVGMSDPVNIHYEGSGDITSLDTIRSPEFQLDCYNGSGTITLLFNCSKTHINNHVGRADYHLSGRSGVSYIYINDVATMDALELNTAFSYTRNRSTGDCTVNFSEELGAAIEYNGNIYYKGDPEKVSGEITGNGRLIPL
jgi:hypothetical protein